MLPKVSFSQCSNMLISTEIPLSRKNKRHLSSSPTIQNMMCSQQSVLSAMDRFVKSMNNMDDTVLVPSKLRDMEVIGLKSRPQNGLPIVLANTDLHSFYTMLNDIKSELLWGSLTQSSHEYVFQHSMNRSISVNSSTTMPDNIKHHGRDGQSPASEDSLGSIVSSASVSSASDIESDADSMINDRESIEDHTTNLSITFRHHLQGLHSILHQLADSADYLSTRYQEEIEDK